MANEVLVSTTSSDQEKFLSARLIQRSARKLVAASVCSPIRQPQGAGLTAYFVRYNRMTLPLVPLTETVAPANNSLNLGTANVTQDEWGDVLTLSTLAILTTSHPLVQQAIELLSDNAQSVIDREIQLVWLAGTNVLYGDGSVVSRSTITDAMTIDDALCGLARVTLSDGGAPPRGGPSGLILGTIGEGKGSQDKGSGTKGLGSDSSDTLTGGRAYVAIAGVQVTNDVESTATALGSWAAAATYAGQNKLYQAEAGMWRGIRWVESNFIPKLNLLGNNTTAVITGNSFGTDTPVVSAAAGGSGTLAQSTTYYWKVTRKNKERGFEEDISIEHTMDSTGGGGATNYFTFNFTACTAGYVYNLYFGSATGDSNLKLVQANITVSETVTVNAVSASTSTAPANPPDDGTTIHVVYIHGDESTNLVTLQNLSVKVSSDVVTIADPLGQKKTIGYHFTTKAMIRDQDRMLRLEVPAST